MEVYAPAYYKRFKCIADKCRHSCCVDWEIDIDSVTLDKYKSIGWIYEKILSDGENSYVDLCDDGRCPFLCENGLCKIIIRHGDEMLSDICREHPRFYNAVGDRIEAGLGLVCEEALRIILTDESPFSMIKIGEREDAPFDEHSYSDALIHRDEMLAVLDTDNIAFSQKISMLEEKYRVSLSIRTPAEWRDILLGLEILDSDWEDLLHTICDNAENSTVSGFDKYYERLLKYFIYRHVSIAQNFYNLRARLGFSMLCADLVRVLLESSEVASVDRLFDIARVLSSEIEYSEDNTSELIFEFESEIL